MSSILTNNGAMVALQTLKGINSSLAKTQNDISTGKSVATAKDNAAIWATSKIMESDESSFRSIRSQLNVAEATVAVGRNGAEQITSLLREMKELAVSGANDSADHGKINTDIVAKKAQITSIIDASQLNGINLLKTDVGNGSGNFTVLASLDRGAAAATTANRMMMKKLPMSAFTEPVGARSTPASPARAMPNPKTGVTQRLTLIPRARDRSASSVDARTIMPTRVLVMTSQTPRQTTIEKTAANTW